jgi:hypothetical protein
MKMSQDHTNGPDSHEFSDEEKTNRYKLGPHIRVEYDLRGTGGNWTDDGLHTDYLYVPCALIAKLGSVEQAVTELNDGVPLKIVECSQDKLYQQNGDPWDETAVS